MDREILPTVNEFSHAWDVHEFELWHLVYMRAEDLRRYLSTRWSNDLELRRDWIGPIMGADYQVLMYRA